MHIVHNDGMDQDMLVSAVAAQLDALSALLATAVGLTLVSGWAALRGSARIQAFSLQLGRRQAFYILAAALILVNVTSLIYFLRLADILQLVDRDHASGALTALGTHSWPYSPFAFFGTSPLSRLHGSFGFGAMIVIWWIGFTTLSLLVEFPPRRRPEILILGTFLVVGLLSMFAIHAVFAAAGLSAAAAGLALDPEANSGLRSIFMYGGVAAGGLICAVAQRLRKPRPE